MDLQRMSVLHPLLSGFHKGQRLGNWVLTGFTGEAFEHLTPSG